MTYKKRLLKNYIFQKKNPLKIFDPAEYGKRVKAGVFGVKLFSLRFFRFINDFRKTSFVNPTLFKTELNARDKYEKQPSNTLLSGSAHRNLFKIGEVVLIIIFYRQ